MLQSLRLKEKKTNSQSPGLRNEPQQRYSHRPLQHKLPKCGNSSPSRQTCRVGKGRKCMTLLLSLSLEKNKTIRLIEKFMPFHSDFHHNNIHSSNKILDFIEKLHRMSLNGNSGGSGLPSGLIIFTGIQNLTLLGGKKVLHH